MVHLIWNNLQHIWSSGEYMGFGISAYIFFHFSIRQAFLCDDDTYVHIHNIFIKGNDSRRNISRLDSVKVISRALVCFCSSVLLLLLYSFLFSLNAFCSVYFHGNDMLWPVSSLNLLLQKRIKTETVILETYFLFSLHVPIKTMSFGFPSFAKKKTYRRLAYVAGRVHSIDRFFFLSPYKASSFNSEACANRLSYATIPYSVM